ncbi:MAG: hypothetical protein CME85_06555 [Henriciella sp.]|uniref:hypothetical protein n=1 Tax=Henriciella sp. TaxID=1968823 RepID=UPI000C0F4705|nr:hypothetical protein [Henriciella sp.]MAN74433.1 hypothetical protein [Henriciella sp.]MBF35182.1 hypothetical protein [Hyphomonadaceae bacterium]MBK75145.1 hypothetical protein [Henriciella sp.]PHR75510.1 MAG: hypothetical protein COA64_12015 [Henriciella sp.]
MSRPFLARLPVIAIAGIAMLAAGACFGLTAPAIDGTLLDLIWTGPAAEARLAEMDQASRTAHFWTTLIIDTAYPLAYGAFLAGLAARFAPARFARLAMVPAALVVLLDLVENTAQMMALKGAGDVLWLKTFVTPAKFGMFAAAALLAGILGLLALARFALRNR